ncbi:hypothetical protein GO003_019105 [Methylicorpusculum oleiharenae]|uniref:putative adhesin n=1 Tax=Methylicorpusculum oleiharenae TaxID=1338687 RepID=UPI001358E5FD|nr:hypothetical protein [Methylicorpusculum oleiharenae]MCD2452497.1 hypothetical protein [Methylicorpusculum oleiharenae]
MKNIFVVGHGFIWEPEQNFMVFPKCAVTFYCKDEKMFDSQWEDVVIDKVKKGEILSSSDISRAKDDWEVSTFTSSDICKNYMLTRPGSIALTVPFKDTKAIVTDLSGKVTSIAAVENGDTLCIKNGGGNDTSSLPYTSLLSLMHRISRDNLDIHIHWLACRSPMSELGAVISQAKSYPALRKR